MSTLIVSNHVTDNAVTGVYESRSVNGSLEDASVSFNEAQIWDEAYAGKSGRTVGPRSMFQYSPVWSACNLISGDISRLPLELFTPTSDGRGREKLNSPTARLVRRRPNAYMGAVKFWRRLMVHYCIWNRAYAWIIRGPDNKPRQLLHLLPDRTYLEDRLEDQEPFYVTAVGPTQELMTLDQRNVLCIEGMAIETEDLDLITMARDSWSLGLAAEDFVSRFYRNGAKTSGILEVPAALKKPARDKVVEGFREFHEKSTNDFKTIVLRDGAKFHSVSITPKDGLLQEVREAQVKEVARRYGIPPHKLGVAGSASYNSLAQENRAYFDSTLSPILAMIADECWLKLLDSEEQDRGDEFEHNTRPLLATDQEAQVAIGEKAVSAGLMTVNEWRLTQNLNPVDGGDVLRVPLNTGRLGEDGSILIGSSEQRSEGDESRDFTDFSETLRPLFVSRMANVFRVHSQRITKEVKRKTPEKFRDWYHSEYLERDKCDEAAGELAPWMGRLFGKEADEVRERINGFASGAFAAAAKQFELDGTEDLAARSVRDAMESLNSSAANCLIEFYGELA